MKKTLKGRRSEAIESIKEKWLEELKQIPKALFQKRFQAWQKRWEQCIQSKGEYFEGERSPKHQK
jgi:hypothetical protein